MFQGNNLKLLIAFLVTAALAGAAVTTNFSASRFISDKMGNNYTSPYGPKPSKSFVDSWEAERAK